MNEIETTYSTEAAQGKAPDLINSRQSAVFRDSIDGLKERILEFESVLDAFEGFSDTLIDCAKAGEPSPKTLQYLADQLEGHTTAAREWFSEALGEVLRGKD